MMLLYFILFHDASLIRVDYYIARSQESTNPPHTIPISRDLLTGHFVSNGVFYKRAIYLSANLLLSFKRRNQATPLQPKG
jgi:hypothetical protein